ncbi:anti-sigma factor [Terriglobus saanensis]|uniref:Anti-sigma K factor RskA n=1 Tax=Terriglobus saanensis (strain ATCC BAA-1853 / DSM 23119 / SP1PR4) TaxID=401053 RepID=E8V0W3_TERSS|nr:anti-sigma factor [Terriglobus saanensis]ADV82254.1 Anti-sigma K factor RskA [Terriglobus saanensis SP1PR4]
MGNRREFTSDDLALYAMQLLEPEEMRAVEAFLATSAEAREELARTSGDLAAFALSAEAHEPPAAARQRLLKQVAREKKAVPFAAFDSNVDRQTAAPTQIFRSLESDSFETGRGSFERDERFEDPKRGVFGLVFPWVGWGAAAALALFSLSIYKERDSLREKVGTQAAALSTASESTERAQLVLDTIVSASTQRFTLTKTDVKPPSTGRVLYLAARGSLVFQGSNLDPLPAEKTYELWLIPSGEGGQPIPAGTFKPDQRGYASVILSDLPKGIVASKFGVTIEEDGGAQTPTIPIVMIGQ